MDAVMDTAMDAAVDIGLGGATVLVPGGVRGVGAGISRTFRAAGATVVTCARHEPETDIGTEFVRCDVRDAEQVRTLVDTVVDRHGGLDAVVNDAGGAPFAPAADGAPRFPVTIVQLNPPAPRRAG